MTYWSNNNTIPSASQCPNCLGLGGPYVNVDGSGLSFGNQTNAPQSRILRRHIFADNMTWQKGAHRMKFGGEVGVSEGHRHLRHRRARRHHPVLPFRS